MLSGFCEALASIQVCVPVWYPVIAAYSYPTWPWNEWQSGTCSADQSQRWVPELAVVSEASLSSSAGAGNRFKCSVLVFATEDRCPRGWLACLAAGRLDGCVITETVHELAGVLQRCGPGCSSPGTLPAPGLPPQRLSCACHGHSFAYGRRRSPTSSPWNRCVNSFYLS